MTRLVICLWLWKGWRAIYSRRDINAVVTMLRERAKLPDSTRILLLTNLESDWAKVRTLALGVEEFPLWPDPVKRMPAGHPNCFRRLKLFDPETQRALGIEPGNVVMSMDADSVVWGPVAPLVAGLVAGTHTFAAMAGKAARIHGSLFAFVAGTHAHLWRQFHPHLSPIHLRLPDSTGYRPIGSDQAWMTRHVSGEFLWTKEHGCYSWNQHGQILSPRYTENQVYWSFAGPNKPGSELVKQIRPDLYDVWMDAYGRA